MKKIKKMVDKLLIYYLIVGVLNFIVCTAIMFVLFNMCGFSEHTAPIVNYVLGRLIWFVSCKYLLFRGTPTTWQSILRFAVEVVVCYLISYYLAAPLMSRWLLDFESVRKLFDFGGADKIAGNFEMTVGTIVYAIVNYFGQRYFVFSAKFEYHRKQHEKH